MKIVKSPMGPRTKDRIGHKIGRWTIITFLGYTIRSSGKREAVWGGECECGTPKKAAFKDYRANKQCVSCSNTTHGASKTAAYRSWEAMKQRCFNKKTNSYQYYGGRGITVCDAWKNSYVAFLEDVGDRPKGCTLDRIDPNGNYEPGNCRWASARLQSGNTRRNNTGYRGVYYDKDNNKYRATISVDKVKIALGRFKDATTAALAYDKAVVDYGLPRDCLNFPDVVKSLTGT